MHQRPGLRRVIVPANTILSARSLAAAGRKLCTFDLGNLIEKLIEELDARTGDSDLEPEILEE